MSNYNEKTKKLELRFIDFGLANILSLDYCNNTRNIDLRGTEKYISPELIIAWNINDDKRFNTILKILNKEIKDNIKLFKEDKLIINFDKTMKDLYDKIKNEFLFKIFKNKEILNTFFGTEKDKYNGYVQKGDIYALGITIYKFLNKYKIYKNKHKNINNIINIKLMNLLQNMINPNPDNRYNILQCLKHSYFTK